MLYIIPLLLSLSLATIVETTPAWNYDKNGSDWNFTHCNNSQWVQSPIDTAHMDQNADWTKSAFSFLPDYFSGKALTYGVKNYVY